MLPYSVELARLVEEFPLPSTWEAPIPLLLTANVPGLEIQLAGLTAMDRAGQIVTAGAGQLTGSPVPRAYFELVERVSIVEAMSGERSVRDYVLRDASGDRLELCPYETVFPSSGEETRWQYAKSNGVAVSRTWTEACQRARWELAERDRVLRSWYGEVEPVRIATPDGPFSRELADEYDLEAYSFPHPSEPDEVAGGIRVVGLFGFPKTERVPLIYGLGARDELFGAIGAATLECIQRLGFLWGEEIPKAEPRFSPTADFHQDFFLHPPCQSRLHDWLAGGHGDFREDLTLSCLVPHTSGFVDLTPRELRGRLFVAKAIPSDELPLTFGYGHPRVRGELPSSLSVHPIA
jgi:hypothetical protein